MRTIQALACVVCVLVAIQTAGSQFSVARITPMMTSSYPRLVYEVDLIGDGNFDLTTSTYRVQETGLYWIHISTGIPPSTEADVRLSLPYYQPDVVCAHSSYITGNDTTSRSIITNLTKDYILYANTIYAINSGSLKETSFGGFSIGAYMSQTVAFFVGKTSPQTEIGNILFDDIVVDTDGAWNKGDRVYRTKTPGLYVISFVTCLQRNVGHTVQAMINGIANTAIYITDTVHRAEDTASITFLASLPASSYLSLALVTGSIYSDIRHLTALAGFLYSPPAANSVAWQLYRSTELTVPSDPVIFDIVAIDTASEWDQVNNKYIIKTAGVYCINLSAGMVANNGVELNLIVNGYPEMGLHRSSVDHNGFDTRGRSLIGRFAAGSELRVALASFRLYSNDLRQTSFSGFRIY